jgi:malate dehydrogenase (quinone)
MSVPHLDARMVDGEGSLMFGPFATFSPKFLKKGSLFDIVSQVRLHNLGSMLKVGATNLDLVRYLVGELLKSREKKIDSLRVFMPAAKGEDWELIQAGQRAQVMKGGKLQFGTEVVSAADGSIAGLLGASPGASTAVTAMIGVLQTCFSDRFAGWEPRLRELIPSYGQKLNDDAAVAETTTRRTAEALDILA